MRSSAWSLRVISVCSALALVPSAWAHLSVSPTRVSVGEAVDLTFSAPNEDDPVGIDHVTLRVPAGFDLDDAEAKPGWTQSGSGDAITWSGGRIPKGEFATFSIRGTAPSTAGTVTFNVLVGDRTGKSITYRVGLDVVTSTARDNGARTLGKAAIAVALVAAVLALAGLFVAIYVWLRPPPAV
ncbi:MAG TPA: DUF1775 domain-containing protein [Gaiellaceae bacterium]|nr:DUF1775 domain-containing protein [Gaiellaceae bacterium]